MPTLVEELPDNKVRLTVDVPGAEVHHAVEHAASDLAASVKIPGFRKGKVPMPVLVSRIGKERLFSEAIESHIAGWYGNAVARTRIPRAASVSHRIRPTKPDAPVTSTRLVIRDGYRARCRIVRANGPRRRQSPRCTEFVSRPATTVAAADALR